MSRPPPRRAETRSSLSSRRGVKVPSLDYPSIFFSPTFRKPILRSSGRLQGVRGRQFSFPIPPFFVVALSLSLPPIGPAAHARVPEYSFFCVLLRRKRVAASPFSFPHRRSRLAVGTLSLRSDPPCCTFNVRPPLKLFYFLLLEVERSG